MRVVMTSRCYKCEAEITFSDEHVSERTGRKIPLDDYTMEPHRCPMYKRPRKYSPCNNCGAMIYFNEDAPKSASGKWVPQDQRTGESHQCPESDYFERSSEMTREERTERLEKVKASIAKMREAKKQEVEDLEEPRLALL